MKNRWLMSIPVIIVAVALSGAGCSVFGIRTTDEPPYEVVRKDGSIEVRAYESFVVARTTAEGEYETAQSAAFNRLFDYISGVNTRKERISMTAPVTEEPRSGGTADDGSGDRENEKIEMTAPVLEEASRDGWTMSFVLPESYTLETAPRPTDPGVSLATVPSKKVAALRYSGFLSRKAIEKHAETLTEWIAANGLRPLSEPRSAGYDPPWTIPFLRRNEVLIDVEAE